MKNQRAATLTILFILAAALQPARSQTAYYVSPDGLYENPGSINQPTTLEGARDKIRSLPSRPDGGITVYLRGGTYFRSSTFTLSGEQDSGTANAPITYAAYPGETVRISGAIRLPAADFSTVLNKDPVYDRLQKQAQGNVLQLDLTQFTTDFGTLDTRTLGYWAYNSYPELFFQDEPMNLARYPDKQDAANYKNRTYDSVNVQGIGTTNNIQGTYDISGYTNPYPAYEDTGGSGSWIHSKTGDYEYIFEYIAPDGQKATWLSQIGNPPIGVYRPWTTSGKILVTPADGTPVFPGFALTDDSDGSTWVSSVELPVQNWSQATNIYAMGFWRFQWSADHCKVLAQDPSTQTLYLSAPRYGCDSMRPFFVYNLLEEISEEGEWYLDTTSGMLYFWPPGGRKMKNDAYISLLQDPLIQLDNTDYVSLEGLTMEMGRRDLIKMSGTNNIITNCVLHNCGGTGATITGKNSGITRSTIYNTGSCGIRLYGGNCYTLEPGNNFVRNCDIHHFGRLFWTYHPGVYIKDIHAPLDNACGDLVVHNQIHNGPHSAIIFSGNNHTIAYNDIHDVCEWGSDAGVIYAERWQTRGTLIEANFIHNNDSLGGWCVYGIYLDGGPSHTTIRHNILYDTAQRFAILAGAGSDNLIEYNIIDGSAYALHMDNGMTGAITTSSPTAGDPLWSLLKFNYQAEPWSSAYPELAQMPTTGAELVGTDWLLPIGCSFSGNAFTATRGMLHETRRSNDQPWPSELLNIDVENLWVTTSMGYVDETNMDLNLTADSPVYTIPGFDPIPFDDIGIEPISSSTSTSPSNSLPPTSNGKPPKK